MDLSETYYRYSRCNRSHRIFIQAAAASKCRRTWSDTTATTLTAITYGRR